jgi:hypothetical protein
MYLPETLEFINTRLERNFGRDVVTGRPFFRVVFSEEQFEKRLGTYTDYSREGVYLRTVREVREVPKYRQWIPNKYVLEGLTLIPTINQEELPVEALSYEPIWVFEDKHGSPLPPRYEAAEFILARLREQMGKSPYPKYREDVIPDEERIARLEEELFGNETPIGDALAHGNGVSLANTQKES